MRRALRASRLVTYVVAHFLYLAFEEALRAAAARRAAGMTVPVPTPVPVVPSVHEMPTLPGLVPAPAPDLRAPTPIIRFTPTAPVVETSALGELPAVLMDPLALAESGEGAIDVDTLLDTLRRDVGCTTAARPKTHEACRAAEALSAVIDRDAVLAALEETVTAAARPGCVRIAATSSLGQASRGAARRALSRMLGVAKSRASWTGAPSDRDLVALLLHTLDA